MNTLSDLYNQVSLFGDSNVPMTIRDAKNDKNYKIEGVALGENGITLYITPIPET